MRVMNLGLAAVSAALVLSACNVNLKGEGAAQPPQQKAVAGPDLSGTWVSDCVSTVAGFKRFEVTYADKTKTISRRNVVFRDSQCNFVEQDKVETGTYRFVEAHKDKSYTVEYRIALGNGWSALPKEKILLEDGVLYLSDYVIGDLVQKATMIPLERRGTP